ncbi:hypothetical protein A0H81_10447 [Grifola frondosa]|uniref:Uncharacterized protein n=1 Tax=Grifola frondosa TaxID=5627 RepID=A0A1C7LY96_GRIFR|nr:hypothetical protein A0H81_10447 [Grifola frondosa]
MFKIIALLALLGAIEGLLLSVVYMLLIWIFSDGMVWVENAERIKSTWLNAPRLLAIPIALHGWSFILSMIAACGKSIGDANAEITWWTPETVVTVVCGSSVGIVFCGFVIWRVSRLGIERCAA